MTTAAGAPKTVRRKAAETRDPANADWRDRLRNSVLDGLIEMG
jgi:hypothetical protein